ncbi:DUF6371 domain-containing protein [Kriegella aquimaris]|uniref:Toprim-like n=1 Tax=Kriegella aquimaris TaxID=192904 RepID=A0A1G9V0D7_9FLAO|nr:DUF6371 domain-containing protein [Kriegella aquimaris]SDM65540.1 hypothetical protein SAMN04488514_11254 [Kriegella aquimaris]
MQYKYSLDKSSKKFLCPKCNRKSYVRFFDNGSGNYAGYNYGRCDRESKCGYFTSPSSNKPLNDLNFVPTPNKPTFLNESLIGEFGVDYDHNHFISFLLKHFEEEDVIRVIEEYYIGTSNHWNGATIFWQIDNELRIRTGKVMLYDCNSGNRVKKPYSHINWMHKVLRVKDFVLQQCLFGLHLLENDRNKNTVCIVESEKTAIIMSMGFPSYHWMATGSKSNLKKPLLQPLKNHNIILYPDKTEFLKWNDKKELLEKEGFEIECSDLLERKKNIRDGYDLADLILAKECLVT